MTWLRAMPLTVLFSLSGCLLPHKVAQPPPPLVRHFLVPLELEPDAQLCVQQAPMGNWLCISLGELRQVLSGLRKAYTHGPARSDRTDNGHDGTVATSGFH